MTDRAAQSNNTVAMCDCGSAHLPSKNWYTPWHTSEVVWWECLRCKGRISLADVPTWFQTKAKAQGKNLLPDDEPPARTRFWGGVYEGVR